MVGHRIDEIIGHSQSTTHVVPAHACREHHGNSKRHMVDFSADVQWLKGRGVQIERYNLAQQPMSFVENAKAKAFLEASGAEGLPLLLLDGETVMAGRYPKRAELARWLGIPLEKVGVAPTSCCGGNTSCC